MSGRYTRTGQPPHQRRIGKVWRGACSGAAWAWLVWVVGTMWVGNPGGSAWGAQGPALVTSNQGVSIEQSSATVAVESAQEPLPASGQTSAGDSSRGLEGPEKGPQAEAGSSPARRKVKGRRVPLGDIGTTPAGPMPWYRTGLGALAVVLAIIGGLCWCGRRWLSSSRATDAGVLRVLSRTTLTPKHSVALIQLGHRFVLVGVSPDRVGMLSEITDPQEVASLLARAGIPGKKADKCFDEALLAESAEYSEMTDEPVGLEQAQPAQRSAPLGELLQRLRTLQTRWTIGPGR